MNIDFYKGNNRVFLILTGTGGSTKGYQNKYVTIANKINKVHGFTVYVVEIESGMWRHEKEYFDNIIKKIDEHSQLENIKIINIYAMGTSFGGSLLIHNSHRDPRIKKVLAINFVFHVNIHLFFDFCKHYNGEASLIIGKKDATFQFANMIKSYVGDRFRVITINKADHHFTNMLDEYIKLPENYLFDDLG